MIKIGERTDIMCKILPLIYGLRKPETMSAARMRGTCHYMYMFILFSGVQY